MHVLPAEVFILIRSGYGPYAVYNHKYKPLLQKTATKIGLSFLKIPRNSWSLSLVDTTWHTATHRNSLQQTATNCDVLQDTAPHCTTMCHTATHCNTLEFWELITRCHPTHGSDTTINPATHCGTLQCTVTHRNFGSPSLFATPYMAPIPLFTTNTRGGANTDMPPPFHTHFMCLTPLANCSVC